MAQDWDIKARGNACGKCDVPFEEDQPVYSTLVRNEEGYVRIDCCEKCRQDDTESHDPYSNWQGIFRKPPPEPEELLKKETAESLLRRFLQKEDESKTNVVYILAVMLERKRILVERDVQVRADGTKILVYEHRKTGESFTVPDPCLELDQLDHVEEEVKALLGYGEKKPEDGDGESASQPAKLSVQDPQPETEASQPVDNE
jgi:hypothetical protein